MIRAAAKAELPNHRRAVFDIVTPHPNSIAAAYTKFDDIAKLEDGVEEIAVAPKPLSAADQVLHPRIQADQRVRASADTMCFRRPLSVSPRWL